MTTFGFVMTLLGAASVAAQLMRFFDRFEPSQRRTRTA